MFCGASGGGDVRRSTKPFFSPDEGADVRETSLDAQPAPKSAAMQRIPMRDFHFILFAGYTTRLR